MDDKNKFSLRRTMMIITMPFLYLFNVTIIIIGLVFSYRILLEQDYLLLVFVFSLMVVLPTLLIIFNNPKKLWKAINDPFNKN